MGHLFSRALPPGSVEVTFFRNYPFLADIVLSYILHTERSLIELVDSERTLLKQNHYIIDHHLETWTLSYEDQKETFLLNSAPFLHQLLQVHYYYEDQYDMISESSSKKDSLKDVRGLLGLFFLEPCFLLTQ